LAATGRAEETIDVDYEFASDTYGYHKELLEELFDDAKRFLSAANGAHCGGSRLVCRVIDKLL
jgi:hypothetical protein